MQSKSAYSHQEKKLNEVFEKALDLTISEMERRFTEHSDVLIALDSVYDFDRPNMIPLEKVGIKIPEENELGFVKN